MSNDNQLARAAGIREARDAVAELQEAGEICTVRQALAELTRLADLLDRS